MTAPKSTCPICQSEVTSNPTPHNVLKDVYICKCSRCGDFSYSPCFLKSEHFERVRHLVSAWIRRQIQAGVSCPSVPADIRNVESADKWFDGLRYAGFPDTVSDKLDALLLSYGDMARNEIGLRIEPERFPFLIPEIAAKDYSEVSALSMMLHQMNCIDFSGGNRLTIKAEGWKKIDQMRNRVSASDSAFIAMWFDPCTDDYRAAAGSAVEYCGYKPLIIDESDFNGFIMDQVVALIRQCRFLIADFTCLPESADESKVRSGVRGGVYWEAGMAYGLGKPVIHTCRDTDESKRRLHFDVAQYRTLFWKADELTAKIRDLTIPVPDATFTEKLAQRILGTIGRGRHTK